MRFLADMGISMSTVEALRQEGHEVVHLFSVYPIRRSLKRHDEKNVLS